jgi:hypothetical protein
MSLVLRIYRYKVETKFSRKINNTYRQIWISWGKRGLPETRDQGTVDPSFTRHSMPVSWNVIKMIKSRRRRGEICSTHGGWEVHIKFNSEYLRGWHNLLAPNLRYASLLANVVVKHWRKIKTETEHWGWDKKRNVKKEELAVNTPLCPTDAVWYWRIQTASSRAEVQPTLGTGLLALVPSDGEVPIMRWRKECTCNCVADDSLYRMLLLTCQVQIVQISL